MSEINNTSVEVAFQHDIRGALVGELWWPSGAQVWTPLAYDLTREGSRFSEPATLREHCLHVLAERGGDFQGGARFADCALISTVTIRKGGRLYQRSRVTSLADFPSIADLVDAEFLPDHGEDSE